MPQRRRYATQDELAELITERLNPEPTGGDIVAALAEIGVPVDALVKVTVDEDVAPDFQ